MYIFLSFLLVLGVIFIYAPNILKKKYSGPGLPPGNLGWPIIGESIAFGATMLEGCPEKFVNDRKKKYSSTQVFKTSILGEKMMVLCGPLGNKLLFSNDNKLVTTWWPPSVEKLVLSGRSSTLVPRTRRLNMLKFFKPEALHNYVSVIHDMVEDHMEREWISRNEVTVYPLSKALTFSLGCRLFMGLEDSQHISKLRDMFFVITKGLISIPINIPGSPYNRALKAAKQIRNELVSIIKAKRSQVSINRESNLTTTDLFSQLLMETDENGEFLPEMDIVDEVLAILIASHDTTSSTITSIVYYLADHPLIYAQVLAEQMEISNSKEAKDASLTFEDIRKMKYSRNVVDEVLRIATPSPGIFREAINDFTFGGCIIPKGWKIFVSSHATHTNEEYFSNPKKFDPSRFEGDGPLPFTFVPFGGGPRMCPGSEVAYLEILIFIHCLVTKFQWEKLFPKEKMTYNPGAIPEKGLPIRLLPHGDT